MTVQRRRCICGTVRLGWTSTTIKVVYFKERPTYWLTQTLSSLGNLFVTEKKENNIKQKGHKAKESQSKILFKLVWCKSCMPKMWTFSPWPKLLSSLSFSVALPCTQRPCVLTQNDNLTWLSILCLTRYNALLQVQPHVSFDPRVFLRMVKLV